MSFINQQVIATHLNISRTTVSRCFTNHKGINPKTRAQVFALASRLGYQYLQPRTPGKAAPKTRSIGILICSHAEDAGREDAERPGDALLPGILEFFQIHHWRSEVHYVSPLATSISEPSYAELPGLRKRLWSGVLLMSRFPPQVVGELSARFPCVSLIEPYGRVPVDCVDVNHGRGITALMDRLRQHGHTRIGFLSRKDALEAAWSYRRLSSYVENLARAGLPYDARDVLQLDPTSQESAGEGYDRAIARVRDGVTAWVCAADHQAYDLMAAFEERDFRVPTDVSITGFDGALRPAGASLLETVLIPYHEIGYAASRRLSDKIDKRYDTQQEILLEGRLQEGETVGPCPGLQSPVH